MISVIIINFKQKDLLQECIRSVYDTIVQTPFEVIVVNNSPEEDLIYLTGEFEHLRIIENDNKGFSHANNKGAAIAIGDYLFFLNPDTIVRKDFTAGFLNEFGKRDFGAVGLKLFNADDTFQLSFGKEVDFFGEMKNKKGEDRFRARDISFMNAVEKLFSATTEVDWVSGAAMIVRKKVFDEVGGFDERFFLYYEDAELCKRLKDTGYKNYFYPESDILHYKGENTKEDFSTSTYLHAKRSQIHYYEKHCGSIQNLMLKSYLRLKFRLTYLKTKEKIYADILKLINGKRD